MSSNREPLVVAAAADVFVAVFVVAVFVVFVVAGVAGVAGAVVFDGAVAVAAIEATGFVYELGVKNQMPSEPCYALFESGAAEPYIAPLFDGWLSRWQEDRLLKGRCQRGTAHFASFGATPRGAFE